MTRKIAGLHHDHIDGSRPILGIIEELYRMAGKTFPFPSLEACRTSYRNPQEDIVAKFGTVTGVLQSREALELAGLAYGLGRAREGFIYVEAKFAPQYHTGGGLTMAEATAAMVAGLKKAETASGTRILPVICIGREADPDTGADIARIALDYGGEAALDLVCAEAGNPPEKHRKAFAMTFGTAVRRDCHAGEWVEAEPSATYRQRLLKNVRTAVYDLRCDGIGHAIPLIDDPALVAHVAAEGIRVAGCPLSNLYCGVIKDVRELGIDRLLDAGVIYTLNPDDDLFMASTDEVFRVCDEAYRFTDEQRDLLAKNVFRGAFAADVRAKV